MPRHPHASKTSDTLSDRVFSALAAKAKALSRPIYPLHVGDTYLDPLPEARAEAQRSAEHTRLHNYAPVQGEPALLEAIIDKLRRHHGVEVAADELQVMSGATAGLGTVVAALLDPGDEVVLPAPFWPLIRGILASRGAIPIEVPLFTRLGEPGFDPAGAIEAVITPRTAAIYLNTPNNPTGAILDADTIAAIAELAEQHDLWVISDDVYADLYFTPDRPQLVSLYDKLRERTLATFSLSKSHALAGARVGYTWGPLDAMKRVRSVQTYYTYCAPRPLQLGAAAALSKGDAWLAQARAAYAAAGRHSAQVLGVPAPAGGTFLFFEASAHLNAGETTLDFLERCLQAGVLLTPGSVCGRAYQDWIRISFTVLAPDHHARALAALKPLL
ncbi:MAG: pyridoxal phosphate-dependent aminotransferase [Proteobacteria bacterium]|nr:pyridoxal phosphate-dependent aminotransferase [Pseudomonadota bacterium]